jgi:DNA-binding MarR family transcriptional regulator
VEITPQGLRVADELRRVIHTAEAGWLAPLSATERRTLVRLMHKIQDGIARSPE